MAITPLSNEETKEKIKRELTEYNNRDFLNIVLKSTLGAIPYLGSAFSQLVEVIIPRSSFDRLVDFTINLSQDIERLANRIDKDYIKTEEVAFMFRETFTAVINNYQKEKIDAFRAIFLNSILNTNIEAEVKELYLNIVKNLTVSHIKALKLLDGSEEYLRNKGITYRDSDSTGSLMQILTVCLPELNEDQIRAVWTDLRNYNMVNTDPSSLKALISSIKLRQLGGRLTPFAKEFIAFIKNP